MGMHNPEIEEKINSRSQQIHEKIDDREGALFIGDLEHERAAIINDIQFEIFWELFGMKDPLNPTKSQSELLLEWVSYNNGEYSKKLRAAIEKELDVMSLEVEKGIDVYRYALDRKGEIALEIMNKLKEIESEMFSDKWKAAKEE